MSPGPDFAMDGKLNQAQKMNNKVEGTPKTESKSKVCLTFKWTYNAFTAEISHPLLHLMCNSFHINCFFLEVKFLHNNQ